MARLDAFLQLARETDGCSDLHLAAGMPPLLRLHGTLSPIRFHPLSRDEAGDLIDEILAAPLKSRFAAGEDVDFTYDGGELGRFRVNVFRKVGGPGAAFRVIPSKIPGLLELGLPPVVQRLTNERQRLVLVTGAAGTGKSTTLAAMIGHLNRTKKLNVITLEDPIEYRHASERALIVQREVGNHLQTFADGLRAALREDPDVIMVGEMRDLETIALALTAAETGHLVLGTLHTTSAAKTLDRIIDVMPGEQKSQSAALLAHHLRGVISQRLARTRNRRGRRAVVEILVNTPAIANLIQNRKIFLIPDQLRTGKAQGMELMDQALERAVKAGEIDPDEAFLFAEDKRRFRRFVTDPSMLPPLAVGGH